MPLPGWVPKLSRNYTKICIPWRLVLALLLRDIPHFMAISIVIFKQKPYGIEAVSHGFPHGFPQHVQISPDVFLLEASRSDLRPPLPQPEEVFSHEQICDLQAEAMKKIGQTWRWFVWKWVITCNNGVPCGTVYPQYMAIKLMETLIRFWIFIQICKKTCCRMFEDSGRFRPGIQWFIQVWDFLRTCPLVHQPR